MRAEKPTFVENPDGRIRDCLPNSVESVFAKGEINDVVVVR